MTTLDLSLFGGFSARAGDAALTFPTRKAQALLAYLALAEGRPFERGQLCALLWGESGHDQALSSLRQTLFNIRKVLPFALRPVLVSNARSVALDVAHVTSDVLELGRALAQPSRESLQRVVALYRGPLLDGLAIDEPGFDEWLRIEQTHYNECAVAALSELAQRETQAGALPSAIQVRLQLARFSPWDEDNHRNLMRLYAQAGRRSAALAHFRTCKESLQRDLAVEPELSTLRLAQEIAAGEAAPLSPEPAEFCSRAEPRAWTRPARAGTPLVCRERELGQLQTAWQRARQGTATVALLVGEAGVGKTTVLDALASQVRAAGGRVLVGRCYESEQVLPFAPWVAALRPHVDVSDDALWAQLPAFSRAVLTRIFSRAEAPPDALPPQDDVRHVFEAYLALIERSSQAAPLFLWLDDLHWADDMSLRLFSFLGRRLCGATGTSTRVLLAATLRKEELSRRRVLSTALGELAEESRALSLALEPLTRADTSRLLSALSESKDQHADERVEGLIWNLSEGNPFVIVEAARALAAGALTGDGDLPLPERVRDVVAGHIARLSPFEQQLTSLAAVIGREFELSLLCAVAERDAISTASAVQQLVRAGVFKESGDKLYFSHSRIREVVYGGLLPQRRALLHGHVAQSLLAVHAAALPEVYGSLALHFSRAGDRRSAVTYLAAFADHAAASFGLDEALGALSEASGLLCSRAEPRASTAHALGAQERARWLLELDVRRAKCLFHLGRFAEIEPCLAPHLAVIDALHRPELKAQVHFWIGCASGLLGDTKAAASDGARALEEAMRCGGVKAARRAHTLLAWEAAYRGRFARGIEHGLAATVSLSSADSELEYQAAGFMIAGVNYLYLGRHREAHEALEAAIALARESGVARVQALSLAYSALLQAELAQEAAALALCAQAVALSPDPVTTSGTLGLLLHVHVRAGRADEAKLTFAKLASTAQALAQRTPQGGVLIALAEALLLDGHTLEAQRTAQEALKSARAASHMLIEGAALRLGGQCAMLLGAPGDAAAQLAESRAILTELGAAFQLGRTLCALAALAQREADGVRAARLCEEAEAHYRGLGLPALAARVVELSARMARGPIGAPKSLAASAATMRIS